MARTPELDLLGRATELLEPFVGAWVPARRWPKRKEDNTMLTDAIFSSQVHLVRAIFVAILARFDKNPLPDRKK